MRYFSCLSLSRLLLLAFIGISWSRPGLAEELKIATWNLDWLTLRPATDPILPRSVLPRREEDWQRLRHYALGLNADIVAFQEVDGEDAAAQVFPPDRYQIVMAAGRAVQRTGFAIRRGLNFTRNPDLTGLILAPSARFPLRAGTDVTVHLGQSSLRLLSIHLKSGCWVKPLSNRSHACQDLQEQLPTLTSWVEQRQAEGMPFAILGDFNRRMDQPEEILETLQRTAPLIRAEQGFANPCWNGSAFIDHILIGGMARTWLMPQSLRVLVYNERNEDWNAHADWHARLSDHCPVSVQLNAP